MPPLEMATFDNCSSQVTNVLCSVILLHIQRSQPEKHHLDLDG